MIKKIIRKLKVMISRQVGPVMIYGFKNPSGEVMNRTRYGSTTYFQGLKSIEMGNHVYIAQNCFIDGSNGLEIGEGCQICSFTSIVTHSSHISIRLYGRHYQGADMVAYNKGKVSIGDYTFIGPNSTIMPETRIGKGSIVAAYSYLKGDFPDFSIIAGNPAKIVGDTREIDEPFLLKHPELREFYNEWAAD